MAKAVHDDAWSLFRRMIAMGRAIEESMKVIAFWIWLQSRGFEEIVEKISSRSDEFLAMVSNEAEAVLSLTLIVNSKKSVSSNLMPLTLTLERSFISPTVILGDREKVLKGIGDIYAEFCSVHHFQDIVKEREEKTQHSSSPLLPTAQSKLNPSAKEWNPMKERAPEEYRCLFLTFSNGYPLAESQIIKFFNWKYGECVERVLCSMYTGQIRGMGRSCCRCLGRWRLRRRMCLPLSYAAKKKPSSGLTRCLSGARVLIHTRSS